MDLLCIIKLPAFLPGVSFYSIFRDPMLDIMLGISFLHDSHTYLLIALKITYTTTTSFYLRSSSKTVIFICRFFKNAACYVSQVFHFFYIILHLIERFLPLMDSDGNRFPSFLLHSSVPNLLRHKLRFFLLSVLSK